MASTTPPSALSSTTPATGKTPTVPCRYVAQEGRLTTRWSPLRFGSVSTPLRSLQSAKGGCPQGTDRHALRRTRRGEGANPEPVRRPLAAKVPLTLADKALE